MSQRYPGGLITKTPVTPSGPTGTNTAPGVWTIEQAMEYQKAGNWPSSAGTIDSNFEYVTLLLPGNGTNGAQNNTFLDSSTNNFTITRNGNTTQGTFSPYGDNWSNYFDGTGDYLSIPDNAAFDLGSGDGTFEAWVYPTSSGVVRPILNQYSGASATSSFYLYLDASNKLVASFWNSGGAAVGPTSTGTVSANTWTHVAVVRSSGTVTLYINGVANGSGTVSGTINNSTADVKIGGDTISPTYYFTGYISNVRIVKGTAVYTSAFTPSTAPLTAITNTSLLTCQSNRFIDNSTNNFTITVNGNTSVQRFSPFSPTASYSAATIGGSGYFDGTGDYLRYATNTSSQFSLGTADFTDEVWVFPTAFAAGSTVISGQTQTSGEAAWSYVLYLDSTGRPGVLAAASSGGYGVNFLGTAIPLNAWTHLAVTRSGNTFTLWRNGVSDGTATSTVSISQDTASGYGGWNIGGSPQTGQNHNGYISNSRLVKGTAVYTAAFTPPTSPLTAITNTSLLLNFTNGGIIDNAMMNDLETVGNAQISTTQSKFGGSSMYFDGTGDYLVMPSSQNFAFGTGDFTIEGWIYISGLDAVNAKGVFQQGTSSFPASVSNTVALGVNPAGTWVIYAKNTNTNSTATVSTGVWAHFALVRSGTTTTLYANGTSVITVTADSTNYTGTFFGIGSIYGTGSATNWNGYIDDLRITKGVARYTANFTPPTQAFPTR